MAKHLEQVPELQGLRDALAFVDLAKDAKKTARVVEALGKVRDEAQAAVDQNNRQYDELQKGQREAAALREHLEQRRRDIEARESSIGTKERKASEEVARANRTIAEERDRIAKREQAVTEREKALTAREREAKALDARLAQREAEVTKREKAVEALEKRAAQASQLLSRA